MFFKKGVCKKYLNVFALTVRPSASCHFNSCFSPVSDAAGLKTEPSQSCSIKWRFCSNRFILVWSRVEDKNAWISAWEERAGAGVTMEVCWRARHPCCSLQQKQTRSLLVFAPHGYLKAIKSDLNWGLLPLLPLLDVSGGGHMLVCHHLRMPTPGSKHWLGRSSFKISPPHGTVRQPFS